MEPYDWREEHRRWVRFQLLTLGLGYTFGTPIAVIIVCWWWKIPLF